MPNLVRGDASSTKGGELTSGTQTIAGAKTFSSALTAASTFSLGGNFILTGAGINTIRTDSVDGSDNRYMYITPASAVAASRGAYIGLGGNEYPTVGGQIEYGAGNSATAAGSSIAHLFVGAASAGGAAATIGSVTGAGAWTLGPSSGLTASHTIQNSSTGNEALVVQSGAHASARGLHVKSGPAAGAGSSSDIPFFVSNSATTADYFVMKGDGSFISYDNNNTAQFIKSSTGAVTMGVTSLTTSHTVQAATTNAAVQRVLSYAATASSSNRVLDLNYATDTDCTGGYFLACVNQGGSIIGRIEAASNTTTSFTGSSDSRLKQNPTDFAALELVAQMIPREYEWKSNPDKRQKGFYAQELHAIYPDAVSVGSDELTEDGSLVLPWGIDYSRLTPVLVKAIQEQQALIVALETRLAALES